MRTCGVEITGSDVLLCILTKDNDVFDIRDVRQTRFTLGDGNDTEVMRKFQFDFRKLMQDYQIDSVAIKERQPKGKFAGSAKGFKMETAIQLIEELDVQIFSATTIKEQLKRNPLPIEFEDTGLKKFQENAFISAYVYLMRKTYKQDQA
ncbi:DUF3010 family protein [Pseudoalteromonas lipolytica]|jgi:hypothetical protein|uniref:DUF3010 family protein n=2 Tax=Pseudoalteromonas lipolytica TaxID=570156 RepID=A0AAD0RZD8_9GAMM|nr:MULTISPECIES: DUF3010 family protein [Pseudoalteromonas]AXV65370.1 DUF3010 family protein [Pseudoalteromonas donghaensis]EWH07055.1 hypothetical protein AT00_04965 [Pseudoalteromonas lipolytica SCSIO 04301]MAE02599.1 DUF3010 domain-containing protein [Pseudoalteromonas sp.]MBE0350817.1 hypothetical protein [Pseudoalteromonas lipolytica LMEB 39]MCC9659659.1 DUF3010 family protein [Pseudoalteromonas sp. MB41]|tara:strand:- start:7588 stop:8034 length:447 start_codon:yes stop_codon:yes gene_type:complete